MTRSSAITDVFRHHFGTPTGVYRAPGRVNIIGAHADYNDGIVLPTTTALYTRVAVRRRSDRVCRVWSENFAEGVTFDAQRLERDAQRHWSNYVKAVLHVLRQSAGIESGFDVAIAGELPLGGGLSSSASLETALAFAFLDSSELPVDRRELALLCQRAEVEFVGARCGVMDQYAISCGAFGHATRLDCRALTHKHIRLPDDLRILVVDTGVKHELARGGLNERRAECEAAVEILTKRYDGVAALRDVSMRQLLAARGDLTDTLFRRCRHIVSEFERVRQAVIALESGDAAELGRLISASHASSRDDYEISCPELEALISIFTACNGCRGARLVGAGFGGCAIAILDPSAVDAAMRTVGSNYGKILGREPWMHVIEGSGPVEKISADTAHN